MRILVCGGRNFTDQALLNKTLDDAHLAGPITTLIHGTARGADSLADEWAASHGVVVAPYAPDWGRFGSAAGPMRNRRMLEQGRPQLVIAFPGNRGTRDMIKQAQQAGVPVLEIK